MRVVKMSDVQSIVELVERNTIKGLYFLGNNPVDLKSEVLAKLSDDKITQVLPEQIEEVAELERIMQESINKIIVIDATTVGSKNNRVLSLAQVNLMLLVDEHQGGAIMVGPNCAVTPRVASKATVVAVP